MKQVTIKVPNGSGPFIEYNFVTTETDENKILHLAMDYIIENGIEPVVNLMVSTRDIE